MLIVLGLFNSPKLLVAHFLPAESVEARHGEGRALLRRGVVVGDGVGLGVEQDDSVAIGGDIRDLVAGAAGGQGDLLARRADQLDHAGGGDGGDLARTAPRATGAGARGDGEAGEHRAEGGRSGKGGSESVAGHDNSILSGVWSGRLPVQTPRRTKAVLGVKGSITSRTLPAAALRTPQLRSAGRMPSRGGPRRHRSPSAPRSRRHGRPPCAPSGSPASHRW